MVLPSSVCPSFDFGALDGPPWAHALPSIGPQRTHTPYTTHTRRSPHASQWPKSTSSLPRNQARPPLVSYPASRQAQHTKHFQPDILQRPSGSRQSNIPPNLGCLLSAQHSDAQAIALAAARLQVRALPGGASLMAGFTLMKRTVAKGRTRRTAQDENAIMISTAGER